MKALLKLPLPIKACYGTLAACPQIRTVIAKLNSAI
jgi:hypothetical protein